MAFCSALLLLTRQVSADAGDGYPGNVDDCAYAVHAGGDVHAVRYRPMENYARADDGRRGHGHGCDPVAHANGRGHGFP